MELQDGLKKKKIDKKSKNEKSDNINIKNNYNPDQGGVKVFNPLDDLGNTKGRISHVQMSSLPSQFLKTNKTGITGVSGSSLGGKPNSSSNNTKTGGGSGVNPIIAAAAKKYK